MEEEKIPRLLAVLASGADIFIFDYYLYPHFEAFASTSGEDALKLLTEIDFDCVIVDSDLKDCRAGELIATIQAHFGPIPTILLTGMDGSCEPIKPINGLSSCLNKELVTNRQLLAAIWDAIDYAPAYSSSLSS